MEKRNALQAALQGKCPRCRQGDMFSHPVYDLKNFGKTNEYCEKCGFQFEQEPGFFYGAMYVSYALSVAIFLVTVFILYFFFNDPSLNTYIISVAVVSVILYPVNFRFSRIIFMYVFGGVKYDPSRIN